MLRARLLATGASLVLVVAACGGSGSSATGGATGGKGGASNASGSAGTGAHTSSASASTGSASTAATGGSAAATTGSTSATTGSTAASTGSSTSGTAACAGPGYPVTGSIFQAPEPWNTPVDTDPVDPQSSTIINWLSAAGGWGNGNQFQIDTSITLLCADASTPKVPFSAPGCGPDCDLGHTTFPVPAGGAIEGETGYACNGGGDCHLLVVDVSNNWLWEMYGAFNPAGPTNPFNSVGGAIIWDLTHEYTPNLRGLGCTSADAGGFPIAAMLFTADEVAAGHIDHAIRFILPNARIRDGDVYAPPATHTGVTQNAGKPTRPNAPPYGVRLRLQPTFDMTKLTNPNAVVVAKALQKYGMFLSDGGNIALTAASDQFTTAKWANTLASKDLTAIQVTDFDVVDLGPLVTTGDCCDPTTGYRVP